MQAAISMMRYFKKYTCMGCSRRLFIYGSWTQLMTALFIPKRILTCSPTQSPISLGISVKPESQQLSEIHWYLQVLPTNTSHWDNGQRSCFFHYSVAPGASTYFPSFPQTSLPVPVQPKQSIKLFLRHVILSISRDKIDISSQDETVYLSISVYWQRILSLELLLKESITTGKDKVI